MSLEAAIRAANSGDNEAMLAVARYYYDQKEYQDSAAWAEKAACAGNVDAVHFAKAIHTILGIMYSSVDFCLFNESLIEWFAAKHWSEYSLRYLPLDDQERKETEEDIANANYKIAFCYYRLERYQEAYECNTLPGTRAIILRGLCLDKIAMQTSNFDMLRTAYKVLSCLEMDAAYFNSAKNENDELIFCLAILSLATSYTLGLDGLLKPDLNRAVYLLTCAMHTARVPQHQSALQGQLQHYRQNRFGGYKFVK